jgi:hypothetical protein
MTAVLPATAKRQKGSTQQVRTPWIARGAGLCAALAGLLYMMWPTFWIKFGIIDDHDIIDIIGHHQRIPLLDIPGAVVSRSSEPLGRFRPVYWLGRVVESATAGQHAGLWYFDRFLLSAVALTAIYLTAVRFMSVIPAAFISLLPFSGPQFETWSRLGPNEAYAFPLMCVGLALTIRGVVKESRPAHLWLGYAFLALAALAKENFLLVSLVIIAASALQFGLRQMGKRDWWTVGTALALELLNLVAVAMKANHYGSVYPTTHTLESLASSYHFAVDNQNTYAFLYAGVVLALVMLAASSRRDISHRNLLRYTALVILLAALQIVFYTGAPQAGRYLYPIALVPVFVWGVVAVLCRGLGSRWAYVLATFSVVITLLFPLARGIDAARSNAESSVEVNAAFETALAKVEAAAASSHADAVVLQPWEPLTDVERVLSLARYISTRTGLKVMTLPATHPSDAFSKQLAVMIQDWSTQGTARLNPYVPSKRCLSIVFGGNHPVCSTSLPPPG